MLLNPTIIKNQAASQIFMDMLNDNLQKVALRLTNLSYSAGFSDHVLPLCSIKFIFRIKPDQCDAWCQKLTDMPLPPGQFFDS